jgi:hypothetical protein
MKMSEIKNTKATVFLGGTCNDSTWREELIPQLTINYFNPVVPDWNEEAYKRELEARENSEFCLYVLTPKMTGVYSIAEVVDDSNKRPEKTVFCFLEKDGDLEFDKHQLKSLVNTGKMVKANGATVLGSLTEVAEFLNKEAK